MSAPAPPSDSPPVTVETTERVGCWAPFVAAVQFLTRIPLTPAVPVSPAALQACPVYFPLVGTLLGLGTTLIIALACQLWPVWVAVLIGLGVEALITGAFHEDAVADFCDAFGGGWSREQILVILKDSRIGTYGALGLFLSVGLRLTATATLVETLGPARWWQWGAWVIASAAVGRYALLWALRLVRPVSERSSLSHAMADRLQGSRLLVGTLWTLPAVAAVAWFDPWRAGCALVLLVPWTAWFLNYVWRKLGGITGDCLGCLAYETQVLYLLAATAGLAAGQGAP